MKVAVIGTGLTRNYERNYAGFLRMLGDQPVDMFIFTWSIFRTGTAEENVPRINSIFKPKKLVVEDYYAFEKTINSKVDFLYSLNWYQTGHFSIKTGLITQWYTIKKAFELIDNPDEYDIIVRYRFDFQPLWIMDWQEIYRLTRTSVLYSNQKTPGLKNDNNLRSNDLFMVASPDNMKKCVKLFDDVMADVYVPDVLKTRCFIPEYIFALHLNTNNIPKLAVNFPYENIGEIGDRKFGG